MVKKKISKKPVQSFEDMPIVKLKTTKGLVPFSALDKLQDKKFIADALFECLKDDDVESFKLILKAHLEFSKKDDVIKKSGLSRRTLFRMLSPEGNPTLENVCKIVHAICA